MSVSDSLRDVNTIAKKGSYLDQFIKNFPKRYKKPVEIPKNGEDLYALE
jgi:hypothetical protein